MRKVNLVVMTAAIWVFVGCAFKGMAAEPALQKADCGRIERMKIYSPEMNDTVYVDVWLPDDYLADPGHRYPVIYMHDGQNLYDVSTTWNHQSWEMDSTMCALINNNEIEPALIVGIHSSPETRVADLMPEKAVVGQPLEGLLEEVKLKGMKPRGNAYAAFMVETLKPIIDSTYLTQTNMSNTTVAGSSMGGLMSIYALCEYPDIFGNALCLSTHWTGAQAVEQEFINAMYNYIEANLPSYENHRLYFDHGTTTIDAAYGPAEARILEMIKSKGYNYADGSLLNIVDHGAAHEEKSWAKRVAIPLRFLLHR